MRPADNFIFISPPKSQLIFTPERGDVEGEVIAVGNKVTEFIVPSFDKVAKKPCFTKGVGKGDLVKYRYESLYYEFKDGDRTIGVLPIQDVKLCNCPN